MLEQGKEAGSGPAGRSVGDRAVYEVGWQQRQGDHDGAGVPVPLAAHLSLQPGSGPSSSVQFL